MKHNMKLMFALVMVFSFVLSACAPAATTPAAPVVVTQIVKETVPAQVVTKEVQVQVTVAPTQAPTAVPTPTIPPEVKTGGEGCDPAATQVTWFIGLGAGSNADVVPLEKAWVDKYNKSQKEACVLMDVVYNTGQNSYDALRALIAGGNAPEIVGPTGKAGRASFQGAWADVSVLAKNAGFDLSKYDPKLLDFTKDEGVLVGLPFALFPSFIYYNKKAFDEAKLPYPPHKVGELYNGKPWDLAAFTDLAQKLTVDKNGNDATNAAFDPKSVTQFGFFEQWTDARGVGAFFDGGIPYDAKTNSAVIPASYVAAWKWYYDGVWNKHFMPNADYQNSDQFNKGNLFASGNVAMSWVHTWYMCCFDNSKISWDMAVVPTINGKITAKLHGDTFAILKDSKNQAAAFKVLTAMVTDPDLPVMYGGMPAVEADRAAFFAAKDKAAAPNKIDWSVAQAMLAYPDLPNHEAWMPNLAKANTLLGDFRTLMDQTPLLDLDAAIAKLKSDLDAAFKAAK
jgi:multiple sugar transport system substrate-binding protein